MRALWFVALAQVEIGVFLAAHALAWTVSANITDIAPIGDHEALAVLVHEHGLTGDGVDGKAIGFGEMADRFQVAARKARVVQDVHGVVVALEVNRLIVAGIEY